MELAELIYVRSAPKAEPEPIAEILGRLIWVAADNGAEILATLRRWLREGDEAQAAIALAFTEVGLWDNTAAMERQLQLLVARFPGLATRCDEARVAWRRQFPDD